MRTIFDIMKTPADVKVGDIIVSLSGETGIVDHVLKVGMEKIIDGSRHYVYLTLSEAKELGWGEDIPDKSPVVCWGDANVASVYRILGFFDKINNTLFSLNGRRGGVSFDIYELLPLETAYIIFGGKDKYEEILNQLED